jgi:hypothetical protein
MKQLIFFVLLFSLVFVVQGSASTCCPECGDYCGDTLPGSGSYDPFGAGSGGSFSPTSVISITHTLTTSSSSSQPSGSSVDYHVKSKAGALEGYIPLKIHFWDESYATQGVTATGRE